MFFVIAICIAVSLMLIRGQYARSKSTYMLYEERCARSRPMSREEREFIAALGRAMFKLPDNESDATVAQSEEQLTCNQ